MIYSALPPDVQITRDYLMAQRQALLLQLEALELLLSITPRTSEIRKAAKGNGTADRTYIKHDNDTND